jgi:hypothetical protein
MATLRYPYEKDRWPLQPGFFLKTRFFGSLLSFGQEETEFFPIQPGFFGKTRFLVHCSDSEERNRVLKKKLGFGYDRDHHIPVASENPGFQEETGGGDL